MQIMLGHCEPINFEVNDVFPAFLFSDDYCSAPFPIALRYTAHSLAQNHVFKG
jgi:hypothetical protein